jgi:hypothetical protein
VGGGELVVDGGVVVAGGVVVGVLLVPPEPESTKVTMECAGTLPDAWPLLIDTLSAPTLLALSVT